MGYNKIKQTKESGNAELVPLTVSGNVCKVDRCKNQGNLSEGETLLFPKSVPEPTYEGYSDSSNPLTEDGLPTWYDWRVKNWGTKWEPSIDQAAEEKVVESPNGKSIKIATYNFDTAWGPADLWLEKLVSKYSDLKICLTYGELGAILVARLLLTEEKSLAIQKEAPATIFQTICCGVDNI